MSEYDRGYRDGIMGWVHGSARMCGFTAREGQSGYAAGYQAGDAAYRVAVENGDEVGRKRLERVGERHAG